MAKRQASLGAKLAKASHPARVRAVSPVKSPRVSGKAKGSVMPVAILIDDEIESLRELRRRLCCYVAPASDKFCDCKYLRLPGHKETRNRSGEASGCCEVRAAIGQLETIKTAMRGGDDNLCQHCGHGRELHSISRGNDQGCTRCACKKFRKKLAIV